MFGHRFFGGAYFGARYFGPSIPVPAIDLIATGFADDDLFGTEILTTEVGIAPTGFADSDAFGTPIIQLVKKKGGGGGSTGGGVVKGQKYGTQVLADETGLVFAIEIDSSAAKSVSTRAVLYSDSGGLPNAKLAQSADKSSVALGSNTYNLTSSILVSSGTNIWPTLHSDGNFAWFLSAGSSRFNSDSFIDGASDPFGASTLSSNKAPIFALLLEIVTLNIFSTGFANSQSFGSASVTVASPSSQEIDPPGIFNRSQFGVQIINANAVGISATGFADDDLFGSPTVTAAAFTISATGFADSDAFGSPTISGIHRLRQPYALEGTKQSSFALLGENDNADEMLAGTEHNEQELEGIF